MKALFMFVGFIATWAALSTWYGYVLSIVWGWFVSPTFGIARLSVPVAIGFSSVIRLVTWQDTKSDDEDKTFNQKMIKLFVRGFILPALTLFFCWIVKQWI